MAALKKLRSSTEGLKIFIASRNDHDIRVQFENESEVYIQPSDNSSDIERFIVAEVENYVLTKRLQSGEVRSELKHAIKDALIKGARGMFLWAAIRKALGRLPKDLEATYSVIWCKIQADTTYNRGLAERTLKWIICAKRPLMMSEIVEAAVTAPMQWAEKPDVSGMTHKTLLAVCQNLVVLDKGLNVLRPAHFSVTEFLFKTISSSEAHTAAAEFCLTLLCCENDVGTSRQNEKHVLDNYALGHYVMENWAEHVRLSGNGSGNPTELQKMFFQPSPAYSKWLRLSNLRYIFRDVHIDKSGYWGQTSDLSTIPGERELNPLWVACFFQLWDIFKYLLDSNPDCTMRNCDGMMPIHLISKYGYCAGVKLLLEQKDVRLNAKTNLGWTPLHVAAWNGQEGMVRLLLGMNTNSKFGSGTTEGDSVTRARAMAIFRRLAIEKNGVHLNAKDISGDTPLHLAAEMGRAAAVRLLLEQKGVLVNAKLKNGHTQLHLAVLWNREAVVRVLVEHQDVDLNPKNKSRKTSRDWAAEYGYMAIVILLDEAMEARAGNTS
ncbi:hypothetical protein RUND412_007647 [Rhizina undulata]